MDYGAYLGRALGSKNPNKRSASYKKQSPFEGSTRQIRGEIIRELLNLRSLPLTRRMRPTALKLQQEGLVSVINNTILFTGT
jgi:hypothetical protein